MCTCEVKGDLLKKNGGAGLCLGFFRFYLLLMQTAVSGAGGEKKVFVCLLAFSLIDKEQPHFCSVGKHFCGVCLSHVNRQMEMWGSAGRSARTHHFADPKGNTTFILMAVLIDCRAAIDKLIAAVFSNGVFSHPLES